MTAPPVSPTQARSDVSSRRATERNAASPSSSVRAVEPAMSVNMMVTVPSGIAGSGTWSSSATSSTSASRASHPTTLSWPKSSIAV